MSQPLETKHLIFIVSFSEIQNTSHLAIVFTHVVSTYEISECLVVHRQVGHRTYILTLPDPGAAAAAAEAAQAAPGSRSDSRIPMQSTQ